jgi:hypothetical protein
VIALAVPLTQAQVDAANRLYGKLAQWVLTDSALLALAKVFPDFGPEASLLKVAAVNQLYGTNLYAVVRMAEHVNSVMASADPVVEGSALVERIAALPKGANATRQPRSTSLASKLAHFFIDAERFPIYDSYAVQMVRYHLGPRECVRDENHLYRAYVDNLGRLREQSGLVWSGRQLDRYLWLAGQYRKWRRNPQAPINTEVARLFTAPAEGARADLMALGVQ